MSPLAFSIVSLIVLVSAVAVIVFHNPVASALSLVVTLFGLAVLYFLLDAPFVGVLQIIVYAGAILVLFVFVIMLINLKKEELIALSWSLGTGFKILAAALFVAGLFVILWQVDAPFPALTDPHFGSLEAVGRSLFTDYLLSFELLSLVILVAIVGAILLAKKKGERP